MLDYDSYGRLTQVTEVHAGGNYLAHYDYNLVDGLSRITDAAGNITTYTYDTLNRRRMMQHPDRGTWTYAHDGFGNVTKQTDPIGNVLTFDYDDLGRLLDKHVPGKLLSRFFYDNEKPTEPNVKVDGAVAWFDWGLNATHSFSLPSWASVHTVSYFNVNTATSSLTNSMPDNYYGYISHRIDDNVDEPLVLTVTFRDNPGCYVYVQLRDANWQNIVNNLVGNLATGSGRIVTKRITVDFQSNPTLRYILIYRYYGDVEIFDTSISRAQIGPPLAAVNAPESVGRPFSVQNGIGLLTAFADLTGQTALSYDLRGRNTAERKVIEDTNLSRLGYVTDTTYTQDDLALTMRYPNNEVVTYGYDAARRLVSLTFLNRPT